MRAHWALPILLAAAAAWPAAAQTPATTSDPVSVATEHPRLFLRPQRLRLLKRESERRSQRWQQFAAMVLGEAPFPERGFALALYFQVTGDALYGKEAVEFALTPAADLRQVALVYDWCQEVLTNAQKKALITRMTQAIASTASDNRVPAVRSRALAAVALYDDTPDLPQKELDRIVHGWWEGTTVPAIRAGKAPIGREDAYPLFEFLPAFRDNTILDLREPVRQFFKDYPIEHLMTYYPLPFDGPDTTYYIGARPKIGDPDLSIAAMSRAVDLAIVAFDVNAAESQVLQGWLTHDKFILKGPFGAPYEFLWANPYLPGLSYYHVPLVYHNPDAGKLFIRSSWDADATWFGLFDGTMQYFSDGAIKTVAPQAAPLALEQAVICFAKAAQKWRVKLGEEQDAVFVVGLTPRAVYEIEIDDEEMVELTADTAGILPLTVVAGKDVGIRLRPAQAATER